MRIHSSAALAATFLVSPLLSGQGKALKLKTYTIKVAAELPLAVDAIPRRSTTVIKPSLRWRD